MHRLAQDGYSVCVNDIPGARAEIEGVVNEINHSAPLAAKTPTRPRAVGISADVTSSTAVESMVQETVARLGPLTLMVANAGVVQVKPITSVTEEDIQQVFSVNFNGTLNCYAQAARQMMAQGDPETAAGVGKYKIVGAASSASYKGVGTLGVYCASKFAVRGLTQAMAAEMAPHNITVNAYAPGIVGTAMWEKMDEVMGQIEGRAKGESLKMYSQRIPLGRTSVPEDVSGLVGGFLAGKDSDYMTGQTILVDGGIVFN